MARRKELKSVASGLYGSFISRNNDISGYWGIGKLCLLANQHKTNDVNLNLLTSSLTPSNAAFSKLIAGYHAMLARQLSTKGIPEEWVSSAGIELNFSPEPPSGKHIPILTWGNLFKLSVVITDDKGKIYTVMGYSHCAPHNSSKESKSAGVERF
jgi:hypothetical protein